MPDSDALWAQRVTELTQFERNLDRAMAEVFDTMVGVPCSPAPPAPSPETSTLSAMIGLAGTLRGSVVLQSGSGAARRIAERLTGAVPAELDATVRDAMGEVANMVAGAWKGYDPALSSSCLLSPPTVVVGTRHELFTRRTPIRTERTYAFEGFSCTVSIGCERAA